MNYRLRRTDTRNITIERQQPGGRWTPVSHHGNSPRSIASGLMDIIGQAHTPDPAANINQQISALIHHIEAAADVIEGIADGAVKLGDR